MEQAKIKALNERGQRGLQGYHKKNNKPLQQKIAYKTVCREEFENDTITITVRNTHIARLMHAKDFVEAVHYDMSYYGAEKKDYEVEIDGKKYN